MLYPPPISYPYPPTLPPSISTSSSRSVSPYPYPHPSHLVNYPSSILPIVSFIHIILGRGGPSTPLKNALLVWNHQLPATQCQFHPYDIRQRGSKHPIEKKILYWFGIINFRLLIVSFIHIILGRGGPSTPLKNPLLVWNHHLPPKSNSLYKNFRNPKIARIPTTDICYVAL